SVTYECCLPILRAATCPRPGCSQHTSAQWGEGTGGTPDFYAGYQRDRVAIRHRPVAGAGDQGCGVSHEGVADGLQALADGRAAVAPAQWAAVPAARSRRHQVHEWGAARTPGEGRTEERRMSSVAPLLSVRLVG